MYCLLLSTVAQSYNCFLRIFLEKSQYIYWKCTESYYKKVDLLEQYVRDYTNWIGRK